MNIGTALENSEFQTLPPAPFEVTFHNPPPELDGYSHENPRTMFTVVSCTMLSGKKGPDVLLKLLGIPGMVKAHILDFRFHPVPPTESVPRKKLKNAFVNWRTPIELMRPQCTCDVVHNLVFIHALKPLIPYS